MKVFTDGACENNGETYAVAGYATLIDKKIYSGKLMPYKYKYDKFPRHIMQEPIPVTNNRAELFAIIIALHKTTGDIEIVSDSMYCINTVGKWMDGWAVRGYFGTDKKKNMDLVEIIYNLRGIRKLTFTHQVSHVPNPQTENEIGNDIVDKKAFAAIKYNDYKWRIEEL